jgi:hypothetical protein
MFAWGATMAETRENSIRYIKSGEIRHGVGKSRPFAKGAQARKMTWRSAGTAGRSIFWPEKSLEKFKLSDTLFCGSITLQEIFL